MGTIHLCLHPKRSRMSFGTLWFWPIFDPCFAKTANFQGISGFSMGQNASKRAQNGLKTSPVLHNHFWKNLFLTHF